MKKNDSSALGDSTSCVVHDADATTGAISPPIHLSNAFAFDSAEQARDAFQGNNEHFIYGRWGNPTVNAFEDKIALLECGPHTDRPSIGACATASGMAAISSAVLATCPMGSEVIVPESMYGEAARLFRERLPQFGIQSVRTNNESIDAFVNAITDKTRMIYVETPANPNLRITDIAELVRAVRAKSSQILVAVDNTFSTPIAQKPLVLGADLVIHSVTKQLAGHGDCIGGVVVGRKEWIHTIREFSQKGLGAMMAPFNAYLALRGVQTLALRVRQSQESALQIAQYLESHQGVRQVYYPGLLSHQSHAIARRQMKFFGSVVAFEVNGTLLEAERCLERFRLIKHAVSLGDTHSLITHPASTTHASVPREQREQAGIRDTLLRLAVGIEDVEDLLNDLHQALRELTT